MPESFDPIEYLRFIQERWKFAAAAVVGAVALTAVVCGMLPARYTATAMLVIEPPAGSDPRTATAVSAVYLESLKTYEGFAGSDSLFAKASQKFHLIATGGPAVESLKRQVLRVNKPKDTKVLEIGVTLPDPKQAQAVAQYLAEETVALNRTISRSGEGETRADLDKQLAGARAGLEKARAEQVTAESSGSATALDFEIRDLTDLKFRIAEQRIAAGGILAELTARSDTGAAQEIAATRARIAALDSESASIEKEIFAKNSTLASLRARLLKASDETRAGQATFDSVSQRINEVAASSGLRTEQLRIVDPGIVPQQPSFPRTTLFVLAAFLIAGVLSLAYLSLQFGLSRQRARSAPAELKVARGGR